MKDQRFENQRFGSLDGGWFVGIQKYSKITVLLGYSWALIFLKTFFD